MPSKGRALFYVHFLEVTNSNGHYESIFILESRLKNKACRRYRFHATHLNSQCYCTCTTSSAAHRKCEFPDHRGNTSTVTPSFVKEERGRLCRVQGDLFGASKGDVGQETACCLFHINPGKTYQAIKLSNSPSYALHVRYKENQILPLK